MKEELDELLEWARNYSMTEEDKAEQAVSFAYGNCAIENALITREMVREGLINRFDENVKRIAELETGIRNFLAGDYPNPAKYYPDKCPHEAADNWEPCGLCGPCITEYFEALLKGKQAAG
jgi:hypothetical protein